VQAEASKFLDEDGKPVADRSRRGATAAGIPGIPAALLSLAREYRQKQNKTKYQTCLKLLQTRYPASTEGQLAADQTAKIT
jgi:gamma-glutamyltranspeptidase/glutathione hydrolase